MPRSNMSYRGQLQRQCLPWHGCLIHHCLWWTSFAGYGSSLWLVAQVWHLIRSSFFSTYWTEYLITLSAHLIHSHMVVVVVVRHNNPWCKCLVVPLSGLNLWFFPVSSGGIISHLTRYGLLMIFCSYSTACLVIQTRAERLVHFLLWLIMSSGFPLMSSSWWINLQLIRMLSCRLLLH